MNAISRSFRGGIAAFLGLAAFTLAVEPAAAQSVIANLTVGNQGTISLPSADAAVLAAVASHGVAVNPVTNKTYVANYAANTVSVIDGATNAVSTINLSGAKGPVAVAVDPESNVIFVANLISNNVTVIDGSGANAPGLVGLGTADPALPVAIAVNPLTHDVFVADYGTSQVTMLNDVDPSQLGLVTPLVVNVGLSPVALAIDPIIDAGHDRVVVVNYGDDSVSIIHGDPIIPSASDMTDIFVGHNPVAVGVDVVDSLAYVAGQESTGSQNISVIDTAGESLYNEICLPAGAMPTAVAVDPVFGGAWVADGGFGGVTFADGSTAGCPFVDGSGFYTDGAGSNLDAPADVGVDPLTGLLYVADFFTNQVSIIDEVNGFIGTLPAGTNPTSVGVNPITNRVYVVNRGSNTVTVIDAMTNYQQFGSPTAVGTAPTKIAINRATNYIYVANSTANTVQKITGGAPPVANPAFATIGAGGQLIDIAVDETRNLVWAIGKNNGAVVVQDENSNPLSARQSFALGTSAKPVAIAIDPTTGTAYIALNGTSNIQAFTVAPDGGFNNGWTVTMGASINLGPSTINLAAIAVNPATGNLYAVGSASTLYTLDLVTSAVNSTGLTSGGNALAVNPATNKIYVVSSGANKVAIVDGLTFAVTSISVGTNPNAIAVNPITNKIYVTNGTSGNLSIIDGATNSVSSLTVGPSPDALAINPATNKIYVANTGNCSSGGCTISVIDGITKTETTALSGLTVRSLAVNNVTGNGIPNLSNNHTPTTHTVWTANFSTNDASSFNEQEVVNPYPVNVTIVGDPVDFVNALGTVTSNPQPTFDFSETENWGGTNPQVKFVYYQMDTWQNLWSSVDCDAGPCIGQSPTLLLPGIHICYAWTGDGQEGTSINTGPSSPVPGSVSSFLFLVTCNSQYGVTIRPSAATVCAGQNVTLTSSIVSVEPVGFLRYQWSFAGNPIADGPSGHGSTYSGTHTANLTITNAQLGDNGLYTVAVTDACGDVQTGSFTLTVNPKPSSLIYADSADTQVITTPIHVCDGSTDTIYGPNGLTYAWSVDGGATLATTRAFKIGGGGADYTPPGPGTHTVTLTTSNGTCSSSSSVTLIVDPLPSGQIFVAGNACAGTVANPATIPASYTPGVGDAAVTTYAWSVTAPNTISPGNTNAETITIVQTSGTFNVTLVVTDARGCSQTFHQTVTVNPLPNSAITAIQGPLCDVESANAYTATAAAPAANQNYTWSVTPGVVDNGQGTSSITWHPTGHPVSVTITLTVTNTNTGCSSTTTTSPIGINPLPGALINGNSPTSICFGGPATITGTISASTCNGAWNYSWSAPGFPTVAGAGKCSVTVGTAGSGADFIYTTTAPITFTLTVTDTQTPACSNSSAPFTLTINPNPNFHISAPSQACADNPTAQSLSATGIANPGSPTITGWAWTISGGNASITGSTTANPVSFDPGTIPATLTLTAQATTSPTGCVASQSVQIVVNSNPAPVITLTGQDLVLGHFCDVETSAAGYTATTPSVVGHTYLWTITNGAIDNGQGTNTITWHPLTGGGSGVTTIGVTETDTTHPTNCATTTSILASIDALPAAGPITTVVGVNPATSACAGTTGISSSVPSSLGVTYAWTVTTPDGNPPQTGATNPFVWNAGNVSGTATIQLTVTSTTTGCSRTISTTFVINPLPVPVASADSTTLCAGASTTLHAAITGGGTPQSCFWTGTANAVAHLSNANVCSPSFNTNVADGNGTFTLTLNLTDSNGCLSSATPPPSASVTITVKKLPAAPAPTAQGPNSGPAVSIDVCVGDTVNFFANQNSPSYHWSDPDGNLFSTLKNPTLTLMTTSDAGTYTLSVDDGSGCYSVPAGVQVNVHILPSVSKNFTDTTDLDAGGGGDANYKYRLGGMATESTDYNNVPTPDPILVGDTINTGYTTGQFTIPVDATYTAQRFTLQGFFKSQLTTADFAGADGAGFVGVGLINQGGVNAGLAGNSSAMASFAAAGANGNVYLALTKNSSGTPTIHAALHDVTGAELVSQDMPNPFTASSFKVEYEPGVDASGNFVATGGRVRFQIDGNPFSGWGTYTRDFVGQNTNLQIESLSSDGSNTDGTFGGITMESVGASSLTPCLGKNIKLEVSPNPILGPSPTYLWTATGPGATGFFPNAGIRTPVYSGASAGAITFTVTITDTSSPAACPTTVDIDVNVSTISKPAVLVQPGTTVCSGTAMTLTAQGQFQSGWGFQWYLNGVAITGANQATYQFTAFNDGINAQTNNSGDYTVTITSPDGCTATSNIKTITVNPDPVAGIINAPQQVCVGGVGFTATGTATDALGNPIGAPTYLWAIQNGNFSGPNNVATITFDVPPNPPVNNGLVTLTLTVTDTATGCTGTTVLNIPIQNGVTGSIQNSAPQVCADSGQSTYSATVSATGSHVGDTFQYAWTVDGSTTNIVAGVNAATVTYNTNGLSGAFVNLAVTVTDVNSGCSAVITLNVPLNPAPTPVVVTASPQGNLPGAYCVGDTITLNTNIPANLVSTWQWYFNATLVGAADPHKTGQGTSSLVVHNAQTSDTGTYTVVLTLTNGCVVSGSFNMTVNALPGIAIAFASQSVCPNTPSSAQASITSPPLVGSASYLWSNCVNCTFTSSTTASPINFTSGTSGNVSITLTVTDSGTGCSSTVTSSIPIQGSATASITNPTYVCSGSTGNSASFATSATFPSTYSWSITNGNITNGGSGTVPAVGPMPSMTFDASTNPPNANVGLTLTITDAHSNGCPTVIVANIPIRQLPGTVQITQYPNNDLCLGDELILGAGNAQLGPNVSAHWYRDGVFVVSTSDPNGNVLHHLTYDFANPNNADLGSHDWTVTMFDGFCESVPSAPVTVVVDADPGPVNVTAPGNITLTQNSCDAPQSPGISTNLLNVTDRNALVAFLNGSSATEPNCPNLDMFNLYDIKVNGVSIASDILPPDANAVGNPPSPAFFIPQVPAGTPVQFFWHDPSLNSGNATAYINIQLFGDVNQDGVVNSVDATILAQYLVTQPTLPPGFTAPLSFADLNGDTLVNSVDLTILLNYEVGNFDCLPQ